MKPQIMLRHNQITGNRYVSMDYGQYIVIEPLINLLVGHASSLVRYLMLNGTEVPGSRGKTSILSTMEIHFKVCQEALL